MYWIPIILLMAFLFFYEFFKSKEWLRAVIFTALAIVLMGATLGIDYASKTTDTEVWSGFIENWEHVEEWDEWIPPVTHCSTDSKGHKSCTTTPGHWVHHYAENRIKTTDDGWTNVSVMPNGNRMDDHYPNKTSELKEMFPYGTPTASGHTYANKVQASYSIYKHENIDVDKYKDLPEYPNQTHDYFYIDRIVGSVPHKKQALKELDSINSDLNRFVKDPDNPEKKKSYKQVNIIFVNVGDKPKDYAYALQDSWEGGNKNDFVVAFSMDKKNNVKWAYSFSWSEVEILKLEVNDYMESQKNIKDFTPIVKHVGKQVEEKFVRKEFADFDYLQIDFSTTAYVFIWSFAILFMVLTVVLDMKEIGFKYNRRRYRNRTHHW